MILQRSDRGTSLILVRMPLASRIHLSAILDSTLGHQRHQLDTCCSIAFQPFYERLTQPTALQLFWSPGADGDLAGDRSDQQIFQRTLAQIGGLQSLDRRPIQGESRDVFVHDSDDIVAHLLKAELVGQNVRVDHIFDGLL